ncbi:hypothetical protein [Actinoalloteichus hymeniacidonis]|uniref:Uncharacterized protein n=1 Tax=Actinoalloteichus hymeniacidonis TaxID=340345 RepID=A0AAC9HMY0_9PSEU|nr:hypothetical protein [Actinoalloteichus hymeniacidonis]AOS62141.1 hypothetical protein TL08_06585 [Actinoalloteichus hymeniacidonis]MBB5909837.1 hypothetical protein [Actinoalloteichus hymeniacidonis]
MAALIPATVPGAVPDSNRGALQRRWDRVRPLLISGLLVLPALQLVIFGALMGFVMGVPAVLLVAIPAIPTAIVLRQLTKKRLLMTPSEWHYSTAISALLSIPFLLLPFFGARSAEYGQGFVLALVVTAVGLPLVSMLVVMQARRILHESPLTVLAGSEFILTYRLRSGRRSATILLEKDRIRWEAFTNTIGNSYGGRQAHIDVKGSFPLVNVRDTSVRLVKDTSDPRTWMRGHLAKIGPPPGPALVLHTKDGEWQLPMKEPDRLAPIAAARAQYVRAQRPG